MKEAVDLKIAVLFAAAIFTICAVFAFFSYATSDDFCHAMQWKTASGWYEYTHEFWNSWTGRWSGTTLRYFFYELIGIDSGLYWLVAIFSLFCIMAGYITAIGALYALNGAAFTWALLCSSIFVAIASSVDSLLFWMTGLTDYTAGYFFTPLAIWLAVQALSGTCRVSWLPMLAAGLALFWACGFSEMFLIPIWLFLLGSLLMSSYKIRVILLLLFSAAGTALSVLAPGNAKRAGVQLLDPGLLEIAWGTFFYGFRGLLLPILALILVSTLPPVSRTVIALSEQVRTRLSKVKILAISLFALAYPFIIAFILFWNLGSPGPGRVHNISLFVLILTWPVILAAFNPYREKVVRTLQRPWILGPQVLAVLLLLSINPVDLVRTVVDGSAREKHQSAQHAIALLSKPENRGRDVQLPDDVLISENADHWLNNCVAVYFFSPVGSSRRGTG